MQDDPPHLNCYQPPLESGSIPYATPQRRRDGTIL
jgi:hypothetical protein